MVHLMFLLSLPDEILCQVFNHLDCWGIVAARLTCWRLHAISKSCLLWQFKALEVSYSSGVPLLEEPVENYTSEELEKKIITRVQTTQRWQRLDPAYFQWRKIAVGYSYRARYKLKWLPGGRWLLLNQDGRVSIMDLDAQESTWEHLFSASDSADSLFRSTVWIDPAKYWLSPRIALHCWRTGDPKDSSRISIYQLNSTGRGLNMKWSAEQVAVIRNSARGLKGGLQLEKEYVLERCLHPDDGDYFGYSLKAYLYQYSDGQIRCFHWDFEPKSTTLLLPQSKIGAVTQTHIKLFAIKPVGSNGLRLQPTFRTLVDSIPFPQEVYQLHSTLYCSYFSIACNDSMLEIQFPHGTNEVYQRRITFSRGPIPSIKGPSLLVRQSGVCSMDFITYRPDEQATKQVASQICISSDGFRNLPTFTGCDVTSGRLIICQHYDHVLLQV